MKTPTLVLTCLLAGATALAAPVKPRPAPCQGKAPKRTTWPQGTLLWGTRRQAPAQEMSSVLSSVALQSARREGVAVEGVRLEAGRLVAASGKDLTGAVFQGAAGNGAAVAVAVCGAEPDAADTQVTSYSIEVWNDRTDSWENPCVANSRVASPRAFAVPGVWDAKGGRQDVPGRFTFACENGAIAKCIRWGYKPWAEKDGQRLTELHQACTRMARADYCGDGRSHTSEDNPIDMYDRFDLLTRTREATAGWDPARASFEAAWGPDGALCLSHARNGQPLDAVLAECPGRFEVGARALGEGDVCTVRRAKADAQQPLLRNHSYTPVSLGVR